MIRVLTPIPILLAVLLLAVAPIPAGAYSCVLSPARDAIIIKTDNGSDHPKICRVECTFASPEGPVTVACVREVPPDTRDWYICLRPTGGRVLEFSDGTESCK